MKTTALFKKDSPFIGDALQWSGILAIIVSSLFLAMEDLLQPTDVRYSAIFFCYSITACYTLVVFGVTFGKHGWRLGRGNINHTSHLLILWFISAFALNKEMNIFESSTGWLSIALVISSISIIAATIREALPKPLVQLLVILMAFATVIFAYYATYLIPLYALGILAAVFIGLSLHAFIPLFLLILTIAQLRRMMKENPGFKYNIAIGLVIPVVAATFFVLYWRNLNTDVQRIRNKNTLRESQLPEWVLIARNIPHNFLTEKYLKTELVYTSVDMGGNWFWRDLGGSRLDEPKQHDPLVILAEVLNDKSGITNEDKVKILKANYNARHLAQERLWSGDHLKTKNVVSNIQLFPEYRMAYTEKTLTIENDNPSKWANDQEAIYTFHLSEGSVISSLSLWIDGKEAKSRLTTKGKADSAYKTIVGIESRDPSVIHWQEGNTISVRVFPCNKTENRRFKLGITSPLIKVGNRLTYQNAWFEGPTSKDASEAVELRFSGKLSHLKTDLNKTDANTFSAERNYQDKWEFSMDEVPLSKAAFHFAGSNYQLNELKIVDVDFNPEIIYLDINSDWTSDEFEEIWNQLNHKQVYVYDGKLIQLSAQNLKEEFARLRTQNFSLFPFHIINQQRKTLVITKSTELSPNLNDLEGSVFAEKISKFFAAKPIVHVFDLSTRPCPYLKTLRELRAFHYSSGNAKKILAQLKTHRMPSLQETDSIVAIPTAQMCITKMQKSNQQTASGTPDHLLRMFAYNDIMKQIGTSYFSKDYVNEKLIKTANEAFIVSPLSSLVVLETQKDYERFGIDESKNSLKNAAMNSSGAAPEPEEWMLIILTMSFMGYLLYKNNRLKRLSF